MKRIPKRRITFLLIAPLTMILSQLAGCSPVTARTATPSFPTTATVLPTPRPSPTETPSQLAGIIFKEGRLAQIGTGKLNFIDWSPDGKSLAVGTETGILLLDALTLKEVAYIDTGESISQVFFSPNSKLLAANHGSGSTRVWDAGTGTLMTTLGSDLFIYKTEIVFSPDNTMILAATTHSVQLWDIATSSMIHEWMTGDFPKPTFSPDGRWVAMTGYEGKPLSNDIGIWDIKSGKLVYQIEHMGSSYLFFSDDGTKLFAFGQNDALDIIDVSSGKTTSMVMNLPQTGNLTWAGLTSDGKRLIFYTSTEKTADVLLYDLNSGKVTTEIHHPDYIMGFSFSPDDSQLATIDNGENIRIWSTDTEISTQSTSGNKINGKTISFSPDGTRLAAATGDGIRFYSTQTGTLLRVFPLVAGGYWMIAFSSDGRTLASISEDGSVDIWDIATGVVVQELTKPGAGKYGPISTTGISLSAGGSRLAAWSWTQKPSPLQVWDSGSWQPVFSMPNQIGSALSPDGSRLAVINGDDYAYIMNLARPEQQVALELSQGTSFVLFSPDGADLYGIAWMDAEISVWNSATGRRITRINQNHERGELPLDADIRFALSADGSRLAAIQYYREVNVWDTKSLTLLKSFDAPGSIYDVAISGDGKMVSAFSGDVIHLWYMNP